MNEISVRRRKLRKSVIDRKKGVCVRESKKERESEREKKKRERERVKERKRMRRGAINVKLE